MSVSRQRLTSEAQASGFRSEVLEKVLHLLNLLEGFKRHPFLKDRLALKGGTALNLFLFDVPRLSVDIDLNYVGALELETMTAERPKLEEAVRAVCSRENIVVSRVPVDHAGGKWQLRYESVLGGGGNLQIDLNYMFRQLLWPTEKRNVEIGSRSVSGITVLDIHELAAGKIAALLSRRASRDLFDVHYLLTKTALNPAKLRMAFVLYGAMNRKDWRTVSVGEIGYDHRELQQNLLPLLRTSGSKSPPPVDWAASMVAECRSALRVVLPMEDKQIAFLDQLLDHGRIQPNLLGVDKEFAAKIERHPMLQWKAMNVRKTRNQRLG